MNKVTNKKYQCPACKAERMIETNHFGETYSGCKKCAGMVMYCIEAEGLAAMRSRSSVEAFIYPYRFDISNNSDFDKYKNLERKMESLGYKNFNTLAPGFGKPSLAKIVGFNNSHTRLSIYDKEQFDNQYVSSLGRVHQWSESIYHNRSIKEGYYILFDKEVDFEK